MAGASISGKIGQINKGDQLFKNLSVEVLKKKPIFKIYGTKYNFCGCVYIFHPILVMRVD